MIKYLLPILLLPLFIHLVAVDFDLDCETGISHIEYLENDFSAFLGDVSPDTLKSVYASENIELKYNNSIDNLDFHFDGSLILRSDTGNFTSNIYEAYFSITNKRLTTFWGKQRFKWGVSFFKNPTDKLQPEKNLFEPSRYLEGIYAFRATFSGDFLSHTLIIIPQSIDGDIFHDFRFGYQLYKFIGQTDFYINSIHQKNKMTVFGASISSDLHYFVLNFESALGKYFDNYTNIRQAMNLENSDDFTLNYSLGISKTVGDAFFVWEYYRNNSGLSDQEFVDFTGRDLMEYFRFYNQIGLRKNYYFSDFSYTFDDAYSVETTLIYGSDDNSLFIYPKISYIANQNYEISLSLLENINSPDSNEAGLIMLVKSALEIRIKAYF